MPGDNVEVVRESFRRWEEGDFDGLVELWHEDCHITGPEGWPEPGPMVGRDAVLEQLKRLAAGFEQNKVEVGSLSEHGDWVLAEYVWTARGEASGLENRMEMAAALKLADGRFSEGHYRWNRAQALEAAGLGPEES